MGAAIASCTGAIDAPGKARGTTARVTVPYIIAGSGGGYLKQGQSVDGGGAASPAAGLPSP